MGTGREYAGFFSKRILGSTIFENDIFEAVRQNQRDFGGEIVGEAVIDDLLVGLNVTDDLATVNERLLTVVGDLSANAGDGFVYRNAGSLSTLVEITDGSRTYTIHDPDWYSVLPWENANGTLYRIYITGSKYPVDIDPASTGERGYSKWVDVPGISVNPDSVSDTGTELRLVVLTDLTTLGIQPWLTASSESAGHSYDCVVYLDTDVANVEIATDDPDIAIALKAKLTKRTGNPDWVVDLAGIGDGYLGQSVPSLVAGRYRIVILGPIITTTDFDSNDAYIHIGTTSNSGGFEVHDQSGQRVVQSMSELNIQLTQVPQKLLHNGFTLLPTFTGQGTVTLTVATASETFINGKIFSTSSGAALTGFSNNTRHYIYWNAASEDYAVTTSAATAFSATAVPVLSFETDGSAQAIVGTDVIIGRNVSIFNETLNLTVATSLVTGAMFTTILEALTYARALFDFQGVLGPIRSVVIRLVGDVTETASIDDVDIFDLSNVTIKGNASPVYSEGTLGSVDVEGMAIRWSFDDSLFELSGVATMRNWTFEGLVFRYANTASAATTSIINVNDESIENVSFRNCIVDGNSTLAAKGGANGYLPHMIRTADGIINGLELYHCQIFTAEAAVYKSNVVGSPSIRNLRVVDCFADQNSTSATLGEGGFVHDRSRTNATIQQFWDIRDNRCLNMNGYFVQAERLLDSKIKDNYYIGTKGTDGGIRLGSSLTTGDVERIFIHDNYLSSTTIASPMIDIVTSDPASAAAMICVHDNMISGNDVVGSTGIAFNSGSGTASSMVNIHNNMLELLEFGMNLNDLKLSTVCHNVIDVLDNGIISDNLDKFGILGFNIVRTNDSSAVIEWKTGVDSLHVIVGNIMKNTTGGTAGLDISGNGDQIIMGNLISLDGTSQTGIAATSSATQRLTTIGNRIDMVAGTTPVAGFNHGADLSVFIGDYVEGAKVQSLSSASDNTYLGMHVKSATGFTHSDNDSRMIGCYTSGSASIDDNMLVLASVVAGQLDLTGAGKIRTFIGSSFAAITDTSTSTAEVWMLASRVSGVMSLATGTSRLLMMGSQVASTLTLSVTDEQMIIASQTASVTDSASIDGFVFVGNKVDTATLQTYDVDNGVFVGNKFQPSVTLTASMTGVVFVGNRVEGTLTDNSTTGVTANNF